MTIKITKRTPAKKAVQIFEAIRDEPFALLWTLKKQIEVELEVRQKYPAKSITVGKPLIDVLT